MIDLNITEDLLYPFLLCIRDKNLPKAVFTNKLNQLLNPQIIQLIKNIIQQKNRFITLNISCIIKLCKPDGNYE